MNFKLFYSLMIKAFDKLFTGKVLLKIITSKLKHGIKTTGKIDSQHLLDKLFSCTCLLIIFVKATETNINKLRHLKAIYELSLL